MMEMCMSKIIYNSKISSHDGNIVSKRLPTGFIDLDVILGEGLLPGLIVLAGRPAMGKTSFAMHVVANTAIKYGFPVAVFSLEMSQKSIVNRLQNIFNSVDTQQLKHHPLRIKGCMGAIQVSNLFTKAPIFIDDSYGLSISDLKEKCRHLKREKDIQLIVIDYLQLCRGFRGGGVDTSRDNEIAEICSGLKTITRDLKIPVIAISQLSRKVEERIDKYPILSDLQTFGGSTTIEKNADVVLLLYRGELYHENDRALKGLAEIFVAKNSNGKIGRIQLRFHKKYAKFSDIVKARN